MIDRLLKSMGMSYTARHHLKARVKGIDWLFMAAILLVLAGAVAVVVHLA